MSKYDFIRDVRGLGLMIAIESRFPIKDILYDALSHGLIMLYSGRNILRLLPPIILTENEVKESLGILSTIFQNYDRGKLSNGWYRSPNTCYFDKGF